MWQFTKIDKYDVHRVLRWSPIQSCFAPSGLGLLSFSDWTLAWVTNPRMNPKHVHKHHSDNLCETHHTPSPHLQTTSDTKRLQLTPFNLRFGCVQGYMSNQPLYGAANAPYLKSSERQNFTHLTFLKHQNTKTSHYKLSKNHWVIALLEIFGSVRKKLQFTVFNDHPVS